jgi:NTE family protein
LRHAQTGIKGAQLIDLPGQAKHGKTAFRPMQGLLKPVLPWRSRQTHGKPRLNLALQGGGSHGAFTWGVLDALLEQPSLEFEGLSGSSAGAMNAVVFAQGWMDGGREGAGLALARFWHEVSQQMPWALLTQGQGDAISLSPVTKMLTSWAEQFSPASLNPFDLNPLRKLIKSQINFAALRKHSPFKLFIGATQVNTGKLRIFREHELTMDMLLASSCLPKLHTAVVIQGEPYWDGGFSANPAVFPLVYECTSPDILLVLLSPLEHESTPETRQEIEARMAELGFKSHFLREMQMFAKDELNSQKGASIRWRMGLQATTPRFHMIDSSKLHSLDRSETKMLAHGSFLALLREQGAQRARQWLLDDAPLIGQRSSVKLQQWLT